MGRHRGGHFQDENARSPSETPSEMIESYCDKTCSPVPTRTTGLVPKVVGSTVGERVEGPGARQCHPPRTRG